MCVCTYVPNFKRVLDKGGNFTPPPTPQNRPIQSPPRLGLRETLKRSLLFITIEKQKRFLKKSLKDCIKVLNFLQSLNFFEKS